MQNYQGLGIQIVANGLVLPEYSKDGKTFIAAPWNTDYKLRILVPEIRGNRHPYKRFLAVISVDGLDVMTGKRATSQSSGYIMTPCTDNDIPGFRLNDREVAQFRFGDRTDSYAAQMDQPNNIGTIGVIFFSEYDPEPVRAVTRGSVSKGGATRGTLESFGRGHDMGTEFGRRTQHVVTRESFERDRELVRLTLEYASRQSLIHAGIIPTAPLGDVQPFADEPGCPRPRNWRG